MTELKTKIYTQQGKESGEIDLSPKVFGVKWNSDLVHQVATSLASSARKPWAHAKTRGEVSGGGKKPWRQKGTGRARHGSTRSPIWVGGGVAHGPRKDKNYARKVNRVMKDKALSVILSRKFREGEIVFLNNLELDEAKTKQAKSILTSWKLIPNMKTSVDKKDNALVIALPSKNETLMRSFGNFSNLALEEIRNINLPTLLKYKNLVVVNPKESLQALYKRLGVKEDLSAEPELSLSPKKTSRTLKKATLKK
jgi:large subunit ribosomal protein L4